MYQMKLKLASMLTRPKLGGCIFPDCDFEDNGIDHLRRGANYTGTCNVDPCEDRYRGESGFCGHARIDGRGGHKDDIRLKNLKNSAAQHLREKHPEREGDITAVKFKVTKTNKKPLERVCREAVQIAAVLRPRRCVRDQNGRDAAEDRKMVGDC